MNNEDEVEVIEVDENIEEDIYEDEMEECPEVLEVPDMAKCVFEKHTKSVFCCSLSKDGKFAATGGEDDKAFVWTTENGQVVLECTEHKDSVVFADFSSSNSFLATGDMSGHIQVWKMSDYSLFWKSSDDYPLDDITWMQWHNVENILFAASAEGEIYMWKIPNNGNVECKFLQGLGQRVECGALLPDGVRLAVGYKTGDMQVLDLKTSKVLATVSSSLQNGHSGAITAIDCHANNNLLISAADDGKTILSTASNGKIVCVLQTLEGNLPDADDEDNEDNSAKNWVETASFGQGPADKVAVTGTINGEIFIWDITRNALRGKIETGCGIIKIVWQLNTTLIYSASLNGLLFCHNTINGDCVQTFTGHSAAILDICISKDQKKALTCSDDYTARIFQLDEESSEMQ